MANLETVREALSGYEPEKLETHEGMRWAAVAAILRPGSDGAELLFIHRAEDARDPWSGHMAFPGGRVEDSDDSYLQTAIRETLEEVGLDLRVQGQLLARLSDLPAIGRGRPMNLAIAPFVFELEDTPELVAGYEVAEIVWVPLSFLLDRSNLSTLKWHRQGQELDLPCYRFNGHVIWGLTFIMLDELLVRIAPA